MLINFIIIIFGLFLLVKGADILVNGASGLAKKMHIPEILIGLTIVSIGTSMPELFVSTTAAKSGFDDISIGNIIGSNLCNLLLILGLSAIIHPLDIKRETKLVETPICLAVSIIFMIIINHTKNITRPDGLLLLALFALFITYTILVGIRSEKRRKNLILKGKVSIKESEIEMNNKNNNSLKYVILIIIGIIALKYGGDFVVNSSEAMARQFNISEKIISLTIVAIGTSLPELMTSTVAAIKGKSDIAIGNIIGSNIFNMLWIIGISAVISPLQYNFTFNTQMIILIISTILLYLFPFIGKKKNQMSRLDGALYLLIYAGYMIHLFMIK